MITRRFFLQVAALQTAAGAHLLRAQSDSEWGVSVIDIHHHWRPEPDANVRHLNGAGIARAVLLTPAAQDAQASAMPTARFLRFTSVRAAEPDALEQLRKAVAAGTHGFGELKSPVAVDSSEMRRIYDVAAESGLPVLLHFQEFSDPQSGGAFNTGIQRFPAVLKAYPRTIFIGHANSFWANISAEVPGDITYPPGRIKPGGLTDRMLDEFPNLYGDLSATSGLNALTRDPDFTAGFLTRHQDKLMFGSDCGCRDGHGEGQGNPTPLVAGRCIARETLTRLRREAATPEVFRKIVWGNATRLLKLA